MTELHVLCRAEPLHTDYHFEAILRRIDEHPEEVSVEDYETAALPLHLVLKSDPPLLVIKALVELYPEALREENNLGLLPLHVACRYGVSPKVASYLIEQYPDAVTKPTRTQTGLQVCEHSFQDPYETIHYLATGGKGLSCRNLVSKLPNDHPHRAGLLALLSSKSFSTTSTPTIY